MRYLLGLLFLMAWLVIPTATHAYTSDDFVFTINTAESGSSNSNQFTLPTVGGGYDAVVDWGDGATTSLSGSPGNVTYTYPAPGIYEIVITRNTSDGFPRMRFGTSDSECTFLNSGDSRKLLTLEQWGTNQWTSFASMFCAAYEISIDGSDNPDLSNVTSMNSAFQYVPMFTQSISDWDVSNVTDMKCLFLTGNSNSSFNQDLSSWDVSNVTDMSGMFYHKSGFNQDLSSWDVSNVTTFREMFAETDSFNQDISGWDVSSGTDFSGMFLFSGFNQSLVPWNVSPTADISGMFAYSAFNQDISTFAWLFNPARTSWSNLLTYATSFNQDLTGMVIPSNITDMSRMFFNATAFNQDLSGWDVSNVTNMEGMFSNSGLSAINFSAILNGWAALPSLQSNVVLDASHISHLPSASASYRFLIDTYYWTINGEAPVIPPPNNIFITQWNTGLGDGGPYISLFVNIGYDYNFSIDWGDGITETYTDADFSFSFISHNYTTSGTKTVTITGTFPVFDARCDVSDGYFLDVLQWGTAQWEYLDFRGCANLTGFSATDIPNTSAITDMSGIFYGATSFNGNVSDWDVSNVTDLSYMFNGATAFNQRLDRWNITNVEDMEDMLVGTAFSEAKYTRLLNSWSLLPVVSDVYFATDAEYCGATAQAARDILTSAPNNWVITDGGATADCVIEVDEEESESSGGSSGTRIGERIKSFFVSSTTSSTPLQTTKESFVQSVRNFIEYLTKNEADLENLTPEESTKIIVGLRDIIAFILKLIPGF